MNLSKPGSGQAASGGWAVRWRGWRNRLMANPAFRRWASRMPIVSRVARNRATRLFDLVAGFTYSQTLLASVESGLLDQLVGGAATTGDLADRLGMGALAAERLLRACAALGLVDRLDDGWWMLGAQGAVLQADRGIQAMIRHHRLLYADLEDPVRLLRDDRKTPTGLSDYWHYAAAERPDLEPQGRADPYSRLMAATQSMVVEQVLDAYDFGRHAAVLDMGGGTGTFAKCVSAAYPSMRIGVFDLPSVVAGAAQSTTTFHAGNFFVDPLPQDYDCVTLIRILHDHDDDRAAALLQRIALSLMSGQRLLIAEPMAGTSGAEAMGDAYFGWYLWAMRSGRPRRPAEILQLLKRAGFARASFRPTAQPLIASLIVATR
ncbi:methyltransferase [Sphingomonas jaspsi]|uniref:methyltransferase n=1 Tax=Sphingomonas jaspsi TaxID=392409 RepID=UPI0004B73F44|nr:methyltransferase [Sphingomonas jaspsi]